MKTGSNFRTPCALEALEELAGPGASMDRRFRVLCTFFGEFIEARSYRSRDVPIEPKPHQLFCRAAAVSGWSPANADRHVMIGRGRSERRFRVRGFRSSGGRDQIGIFDLEEVEPLRAGGDTWDSTRVSFDATRPLFDASSEGIR